jgi:hypothetical protein
MAKIIKNQSIPLISEANYIFNPQKPVINKFLGGKYLQAYSIYEKYWNKILPELQKIPQDALFFIKNNLAGLRNATDNVANLTQYKSYFYLPPYEHLKKIFTNIISTSPYYTNNENSLLQNNSFMTFLLSFVGGNNVYKNLLDKIYTDYLNSIGGVMTLEEQNQAEQNALVGSSQFNYDSATNKNNKTKSKGINLTTILLLAIPIVAIVLLKKKGK